MVAITDIALATKSSYICKAMISVHIPNNFIPERSYAVQMLLTQYCGIPVEIEVVEGIQHYELTWGNKSIIIKDDFFGKIPEATHYAGPKFLPYKIMQTTSVGLEGILMLFGKEQLEITPEKMICHIDLFAGVFFMLTRWEESLEQFVDKHNRFPAARSVVVRDGFILRPIVDEYATLLRNWLGSLGYVVPPDSSTYTVVPTCDVDLPYYWRTKSLWKILGGRLKKHLNPFKIPSDLKEYKATQRGHKNDPYDTFEYLMSLSEKAELRFQFNFIGGGKSKFEGHYRIDDPAIKSLMQQMISRGHQIGLHPSYDAYNNSSMIADEKHAVESSAGVSIFSSRQHYLRFALPETWRRLHAAGIKEDSTLGYAAEPGFRCGTCKPFPVFDIHDRKQLELIERPLLIMDVSFRMYKKISIAESLLLSEKIKEQVKKHNGELVILWHNSSLSEIDGWEGWNRVLENLIQG